MGQGHNNDDDDSFDKRRDLTRLEDISEFLHSDDPDVDSKFGSFDSPPDLPVEEAELPALPPDTNNLFSTEENEFNFPTETDFQTEAEAEPLTQSVDDLDDSFAFSAEPEAMNDEFNSEELLHEVTDAPLEYDYQIPDLSDDLSEETNEVTSQFEPSTITHTTEKFEEVKNFAQNFSYGQVTSGGNPPFSVVIRNLKFEEDKEDIVTILRDLGFLNEKNQEDYLRALSMGSLLIPQISEYAAIVLAHKLRRFDCDLEMGLSDEVHPSKSGEHNPKGLMKRESLRQNILEHYHASENDHDISMKEVLVSTTSTLEGYIIKKYIGVQTSFAIVDEEELERLKFVQSQERSHSAVINYDTDQAISSKQAFMDYKSSFEHLFVDLRNELKSRAMKEKANALLGLSYQLMPLPFEKTSQGRNCYQLTCSATLAVVKQLA
jgi:hypothetical protein